MCSSVDVNFNDRIEKSMMSCITCMIMGKVYLVLNKEIRNLSVFGVTLHVQLLTYNDKEKYT